MSGELLKTVGTFYEGFGAGDLDTATERFDVAVESVAPGATMEGVEAFRAYGQVFKTAFPDSRMTVLSAVEAGDTVAIEGLFTGTHTGPLVAPEGEIPATGRSIELPYCDVFRITDGRIISHHVYYDRVTFMTQLGLMPNPAEASA